MGMEDGDKKYGQPERFGVIRFLPQTLASNPDLSTRVLQSQNTVDHIFQALPPSPSYPDFSSTSKNIQHKVPPIFSSSASKRQAVHTELPQGQQTVWRNFGRKLKTAFVNGQTYHWCDRCGGWIEGKAQCYKVNSLRPLSGRRGKGYNCRRCGGQIVFVGVIS